METVNNKLHCIFSIVLGIHTALVEFPMSMPIVVLASGLFLENTPLLVVLVPVYLKTKLTCVVFSSD